jgi:hypothetical protein
VYIFVNNNTNLNFLKILSNYTIWDRLNQKTISRYVPFIGDYDFTGHVANPMSLGWLVDGTCDGLADVIRFLAFAGYLQKV